MLAMECSKSTPARIGWGTEQVMSSGGYSGGDPPVPIPNTEVKPASADGTWGVDPRESRTPPGTTLRAVRSVRAALALLQEGSRPAVGTSGLSAKQPGLFWRSSASRRCVPLPQRAAAGTPSSAGLARNTAAVAIPHRRSTDRPLEYVTHTRRRPDDRSDDLPERSDGGERTPVRDGRIADA